MKRKAKAGRKMKTNLREMDFSKTLGNPELVFSAFMACLQEGDHVAAREILAGGLRYMNVSKFSRRHGIPRRSLYNLIGKDVVPGLDLVAKVCCAIKRESVRR